MIEDLAAAAAMETARDFRFRREDSDRQSKKKQVIARDVYVKATF